MLAIQVEFLHATFRGDPTGAANTGNLTRGEWPPAPSRLFAALVAADGTGDRCRVTDGAELEWFEQLLPPVIHADAAARTHHQELQPRYVVEQRPHAVKATHQEYVGRIGALIRPGVRVAPRHAEVVFRWDGETPSEAIFGALRRRAARIGYLGAADSPARVRVWRRMPESAPSDCFVPDPDGDALVGIPAPGDLRTLDRLYDAWREHGANANRSWFPALQHKTRYSTPRNATPRGNGDVVAWLRFGDPIPGRRVSAVTALFKAAVLSRYQALHGEPPATLHGHGVRSKGYDVARYLALPNVGFPFSRGQIHGLALWMPPGTDADTCRRTRDATRDVRRLFGSGVDVPVAWWEDQKRPLVMQPDRWVDRRRARQPRLPSQKRPLVMQPDRWTRKSRRWATAFPAIHERRRVLDLAEVARWCRHAGLPAPVWFRAARTPLLRGAVDLAPVEVNRPGRQGLPYSHVEIRFAHPVPGPVVIGAGRQRGLGLCAQIDD